jgi:hypothetical protein
MRQVVLLTQEQKDQIQGQKFAIDSYFLPIEDIDGNWTVSTVEQELCTHPDFQWIKHCPRIEYKPKPYPMPEEQTPVQE